MCKVTVDINEKLLRDVLPELENPAAISRWAQLLIDQHIHQLHRVINRENALEKDLTPEQLYDVIAEEIDSIYANG